MTRKVWPLTGFFWEMTSKPYVCVLCLIRLSFFTWGLGANTKQSMLIIGFMVESLGHLVSTWPLEGLESKFSQEVVSHPYKINSRQKPWTPRLGWASLVGNTPCMLLHIWRQKQALPTEDDRKPVPGALLVSALCVFTHCWS